MSFHKKTAGWPRLSIPYVGMVFMFYVHCYFEAAESLTIPISLSSSTVIVGGS
jgi:hypothetical protein